MSDEILTMNQARKKLSREILKPLNKVSKKNVLTSGRFKIIQAADSNKGHKWKLTLKRKAWSIRLLNYKKIFLTISIFWVNF